MLALGSRCPHPCSAPEGVEPQGGQGTFPGHTAPVVNQVWTSVCPPLKPRLPHSLELPLEVGWGQRAPSGQGGGFG